MSERISIVQLVRGGLSLELTDVFKHFVALVEDEHFDVLKAEGLVAYES